MNLIIKWFVTLNRGCGVWKLLLGCLEFLIKIIGSLIVCGKIYEVKGKERILFFGKILRVKS